jgi:hypothetical protein
VRDAGAESREERGAGRDRRLARRTGALTAVLIRIAGAILVDAFAFVIWNLATRSPAQLARDVAGGLRSPATALRGTLQIAVGLLLLVAGVSLIVPIAPDGHAFLILETWTVVTGLLVEQLIGGDFYNAIDRFAQR